MKNDNPIREGAAWAIVGALLVAALLGFWVGHRTASAHPTPEPRLAEIRQCESGGHYSMVNEGRSETHWDGQVGSYGAYMFGQGTFDWVVGTMGMDWAAGIRPDRVPWWFQDAVARRLLWLELHDDLPGERNYSWRVC